MSNDWLPYKGTSNINYIVTAFLNEEDDENVEIVKDIQEDVEQMRMSTNKELEEILIEIKKVKSKINAI